MESHSESLISNEIEYLEETYGQENHLNDI